MADTSEARAFCDYARAFFSDPSCVKTGWGKNEVALTLLELYVDWMETRLRNKKEVLGG